MIVEEENDPKIIELDENRMKYTNKEYDITIIEIKEKDEINNFLELDDKIMDDIINNVNKINKYINEIVYIIQYPNGKLSVSYGTIEEIDTDKKYNFSHRCCTGRGSSGSPILTTDNKLIGIHKIGVEERDKISNVGTFLNYPIIDFNKQFASSENLLKEFNMNYNINININDLKILANDKKFGDKGFENLCNIEFKKLKELYLRDNKISNIQILESAKFNRLEILIFRGNKITDINILEKVNFKELKSLDLYGNNISNIKVLEVAKFNKLEKLELGMNKISDIEALGKVNFPELKYLNLRYNYISNITILEKVDFKKLEYLCLDYNKIMDINVLEKVNFPILKILHLNNNNISDIKVLEKVAFNKLEGLLLNNNKISDIEEFKKINFKELKELNLDGNNISKNDDRVKSQAKNL